MKSLATLLIALALPWGMIAQTDQSCACCTASHTQFDFWVGDWNVFDTTGTKVGENTIVKLEKDCILSEHWRGAKGSTGRSYNYYNAQDDSWNQTWVDSNGGSLLLKGKAGENKMVLKSDLVPGKKVDFYYNQITWTNNPDGTVTQTWEVFDQAGKKLGLLFKGVYKRKHKE